MDRPLSFQQSAIEYQYWAMKDSALLKAFPINHDSASTPATTSPHYLSQFQQKFIQASKVPIQIPGLIQDIIQNEPPSPTPTLFPKADQYGILQVNQKVLIWFKPTMSLKNADLHYRTSPNTQHMEIMRGMNHYWTCSIGSWPKHAKIDCFFRVYNGQEFLDTPWIHLTVE